MAIPLYDHICDLLRRPAVQIVCVLLLGLLAYSNTFHVPFVFDDIHVIVENRSLDSLSAFLTSDYARFRDARWFPLITFAINRSLGGFNVTGFHVVNLLIHLSVGIVIYVLTATTIASFGSNSSRRYSLAPFVAALVFVLHPLHTQSVTYIVQRMTSLATLGYLASILFYVKAVGAGEGNDRTDHRFRWFAYVAALVCALLAMGSKEISFTLPLMVVVYDLCFLRGNPQERCRRLIPFFICLLVMFFQLVGAEKLLYVQTHGGGDSVSHAMPRQMYLITQLCVLMTYLRLLVVPVGQNLDYDYPKFTSLLEPQVAVSFLFLALFAALGAYLVKRSFSHESSGQALVRMAGFAIVWFFITISIESGLVPLIDTIFEHRVYLPSVWLFVVFGMGVGELCHRWQRLNNIFVVTVIAAVMVLGVATYRRNLVWSDHLTLWTDITNKSPGRARGWTNLGMYYVNRLDPTRAVPFLEHAVDLNPEYYPAHYWLGRALVLSGDADRALEHYLQLTVLAPDFPKGWEAAGRILLEKNYVPEALNFLNRSIELDPEGFASHGHLQKAMALSGAQPGMQKKNGQ